MQVGIRRNYTASAIGPLVPDQPGDQQEHGQRQQHHPAAVKEQHRQPFDVARWQERENSEARDRQPTHLLLGETVSRAQLAAGAASG